MMTIVYTSSNSSVQKSTSLMVIALAQNLNFYEQNGGNMTWDNVADALNSWDNNLPWNDFKPGERTYNNDFCDKLHDFCDAYNLTGSPVGGLRRDPNGIYLWVTVDSCDGQPTAC